MEQPAITDKASDSIEADTEDTTPSLTPSYVVAIGASAGGLDALEKLFDKLPSDSGAAFVVIQHLSPDHKSIMDSLLARHTSMPIKTVTHNMVIEADHVYLIPPGSLMHLEGNRFLLTPKFPRTLNLPIDVFFQSLATNYKERSVGVVLSGTGSDGTRGAGAINEAGGLLIAQEPESAKFDGMPRSIISTGLVDVILPVHLMGERIYAHVVSQGKSNITLRRSISDSAQDSIEQAYNDILQLLSHSGGINFADYKPGTVTRRIERRMTVRQVNTLEEYCELLNDDETEIQTLRRELLIPVTSFFRDPDAFEALKRHVVDVLLERKPMEQGIRVWCAGISTGEEAYSIGMLFLEAFEQAKHWPSLKIFATDVEQQNIDTASTGLYPESIMAELTPEQLERFFTKRGNQYEVKNELRQCIVFAKHNLLSHPPFTKMDLVVCRNVLIYFKADAQLRVLRRLQFALKPNSFLFLGSSETLGPLQSDFQTVSQRQKIWKVLKPSAQPLDLEGRSIHNYYTPSSNSKKAAHSLPWQRTGQSNSFVQRGYETLLNAYAPPAAILVGPNQEMLHSYGNMNRYLQFRPGQASLDLNRILPEPLIPVASALLFKTMRELSSTVSDVIRVALDPNDEDGTKTPIRLSAWPVPFADPEDKEPRMSLLVFEEVSEASGNNPLLPVDVQLATSERMEILQHELAATRESLQATIEELETSNEELQATNEEMMASNEELQSSNEELQSVNEELNTVNSEYQEKIDILNRVNADLDNLAKVVASGTVFVDENLCITRFSADATEIFKLRDTDIARPLSDISHILDYPNLSTDLLNAIHSNSMVEKEINTINGKVYMVKMLPYQVASSASCGLVINFIDITKMRQANKMQEVLNATFNCLAVLDQNGDVILCNEAWNNDKAAFSAECDPRNIATGENYYEFLLKMDMPWAQLVHQELETLKSGAKDRIKLRLPGTPSTLFLAKKLDQPQNSLLVEIINLDQF